MSKDFKLDVTNGGFKVAGKVVGITGDNAMREGEVGQGKNEGKSYRSLRFGVQTSPNNRVNVELFGMEMDEVTFYEALSKEDRNKGKKGKNKTVDWDDRFSKPKGYVLPFFMAVNTGLETDDKGKQVKKSMIGYDAVQYIYDSINEDDSVYVTGDIQYQEYTPEGGDTITQEKFVIKYISINKKGIDFENEKFKEVAAFQQDIVYQDAIKEEDKVMVSANTIMYGDKVFNAQFVVDMGKNKKLATSIKRKLKTGDWLTVYGNIINGVQEVNGGTEEEDEWGDVPTGYGNSGTIVREMQITRVDPESIIEKKYKPEDLIIDEEFAQEEEEAEDFSDFEEEIDGDEEEDPFE